MIQDFNENGGRILTAEQEEFFKKNDIEVEYVDNNDDFSYMVIPAEPQLLMEEEMNHVVASEGGLTATAGTAATAGSAGSVFTVSSVLTCSSLSTAGSVGTAGTAGSVSACLGGQRPATAEEQANSNAFASLVSNRINS